MEAAELEAAAAEDAAEAVLLLPEDPRPRSLRLPRNRGAIKEE